MSASPPVADINHALEKKGISQKRYRFNLYRTRSSHILGDLRAGLRDTVRSELRKSGAHVTNLTRPSRQNRRNEHFVHLNYA